MTKSAIQLLESDLQEVRYQLERVVAICLDSRKIATDRQAAYLRDEILTLVDPWMNITQRIQERRQHCGHDNP